MTYVPEQSHLRLSPERHALPAAPLAMPEQVLERRRERGVVFAPLLRWFAWK